MTAQRTATTGGRTDTGSRRDVVSLAWPLAVGMVSFTIMGVVDTLLMGHVSTVAQAGVGLATIIAYAATAFFRGLTTGPQSLVAAADGASDRARVEDAASSAVLIGAVTGLIAAVLIECVRRLVLPSLVDDPTIIAHADAYLKVRVWGVPLMMLSFGLMPGLQGLGDTRARMWASIAGNVVNIGLDVVLIFGVGAIPAMGAQGAAIATVAGTATMLVVYALRYKRLLGTPRRPSREVLRSGLTVGLPSGTQQMFGSMAFMATTVFIGKAGAAHLAASEVVLNIISVSFLPGFGIGEATGILVGRAMGSGNLPLAAQTIRSGRSVALFTMGACGVFFALGGHWLSGFFNPDPEVRTLIAQLLLFAAVFQLFDAVAMTHLCVLRAAGDTRFTLVLTTTAAWGITVPAAWFLGSVMGLGAPGAWIGITVEIAILAAITAWRVKGLATGKVGRLDLLLGKKAIA